MLPREKWKFEDVTGKRRAIAWKKPHAAVQSPTVCWGRLRNRVPQKFLLSSGDPKPEANQNSPAEPEPQKSMGIIDLRLSGHLAPNLDLYQRVVELAWAVRKTVVWKASDSGISVKPTSAIPQNPMHSKK